MFIATFGDLKPKKEVFEVEDFVGDFTKKLVTRIDGAPINIVSRNHPKIPVVITFNLQSKHTSRLVSGRVYRLASHFAFTNPKLTSRLGITSYRRNLSWIICPLRIRPIYGSVCLIRFCVNSLIDWTGNERSFTICKRQFVIQTKIVLQ